jgi:glycine oxidase
MAYDVIVIGGGAIGLAVARNLAADHSVLLLERGLPGREASWAAAGMLCPHGEATRDDALFRFGLSSLRMYRGFVDRLESETGVDTGYRDAGTLVLASSEEEWDSLRRRHRWQEARGLGTSLVTPEWVRAQEPGLTLAIRGALECPADHQIQPRGLLEALRKSCAIRGVEIRPGVPVEEILRHGRRVRGVRSGSRVYEAASVVVAAGAWSGGLRGLAPEVRTRPMKGQILAVAMPGGDIHRVLRWGPFYLAPRQGGELVVGATDEDCGFDRKVTAGALAELLGAARRMASVVGEFRVLEIWTGLRPQVADGLPVMGPAGPEGLFYAFGHYRNGILHTPATADLIGEAVRGRSPAAPDAVFSPMRFETGGVPPDGGHGGRRPSPQDAARV